MTHNSTPYEQDFYAWTQEQATLLDARAFEALDLPHLIEEVLSLGKSQLRELRSHLFRLLEHLLKLHVAAQHLPADLERAGRGWRLSVQQQRLQTEEVLHDNPSLRPFLAHAMARAYPLARLEALKRLRIGEEMVPPACLWSPEQVLDPDFWPEEEPTA